MEVTTGYGIDQLGTRLQVYASQAFQVVYHLRMMGSTISLSASAGTTTYRQLFQAQVLQNSGELAPAVNLQTSQH